MHPPHPPPLRGPEDLPFLVTTASQNQPARPSQPSLAPLSHPMVQQHCKKSPMPPAPSLGWLPSQTYLRTRLQPASNSFHPDPAGVGYAAATCVGYSSGLMPVQTRAGGHLRARACIGYFLARVVPASASAVVVVWRQQLLPPWPLLLRFRGSFSSRRNVDCDVGQLVVLAGALVRAVGRAEILLAQCVARLWAGAPRVLVVEGWQGEVLQIQPGGWGRPWFHRGLFGRRVVCTRYIYGCGGCYREPWAHLLVSFSEKKDWLWNRDYPFVYWLHKSIVSPNVLGGIIGACFRILFTVKAKEVRQEIVDGRIDDLLVDSVLIWCLLMITSSTTNVILQHHSCHL